MLFVAAVLLLAVLGCVHFTQDLLIECSLCFFLRDLSSLLCIDLSLDSFICGLGLFKVILYFTLFFVQGNTLQGSFYIGRDTGSLFCLRAFCGSLCSGEV